MFGEADGNSNTRRADRDHGGVFFGGHSRLSLNARNGLAEVDTAHVGGYGAAALGAVELSGGAAYAWNFVDTTRTVAFPGFANWLEADYDAGTMQVFGEIGDRAELGGVGLKPFTGIAYVNVDTDGFTEWGGAARPRLDRYSVRPDHRGGEMNEAGVVDGSPVVAGRKAAEVLEAVESPLDAIAVSVSSFVM